MAENYRLKDLEALYKDRRDAATQAFDAIAELCGCKEWEYPGQVVRDVETALEKLTVDEGEDDV